MAKPNYQFEKRQRDIAKKKKKDEKLAKRQSRTGTGEPDAAPEANAPAPVPGKIG